MTGFDTTFDPQPTAAAKTSGLAIGSLVCSLICCLPVTTILGILLGIGAVISIGGDPAKKGKGLAITGIVLGIVFTIMQLAIGVPTVRAYFIFRDAPLTALKPGFDGDVVAMKSKFASYATSVADEEAQAFIDELRRRYGNLLESRANWVGFQGMKSSPGQTAFDIPWVLVFENAEVEVEGTIRQEDQDRSDIMVFYSIRVIDPTLGDLVFPAQTAAPSADAPDTADTDDEAESAPGDDRDDPADTDDPADSDPDAGDGD